MLPPSDICERARRSRDARFDGRFFTGVLSTGIYCRPVCPARLAAADNVRFFPSSAAAETAGFRPCLRCRPECSPGQPEWTLSSERVLEALRLIDEGVLNGGGVAALAGRLGLSPRHLGRLFRQELQATPLAVARSRRVQLAKHLIDTTALPLTDIALQAGFGSVRRFNAELRRIYGRPPGALRRGPVRSPAASRIVVLLPVRQPFNADWVFGFLAQRALPGLETVSGWSYQRRLPAAGGSCWLNLCYEAGTVRLDIPAEATQPVHELVARVRRLLDLTADPAAIDGHLIQSPELAGQIQAAPGLRVPGAFDDFEILVRGVLGQQVSVAAARTLAARLMTEFGDGAFPAAAALAPADLTGIGLPGARAAAINALARRVVDGRLPVGSGLTAGRLREGLLDIPGIGPWTAEYLALRVGRDPDAFPDTDAVVKWVLGRSPAHIRALAQGWRPWRSYALMALWRAASLPGAAAPAAVTAAGQGEA